MGSLAELNVSLSLSAVAISVIGKPDGLVHKTE